MLTRMQELLQERWIFNWVFFHQRISFAGILGVRWSFQRSSRCFTQCPGAKLSEGSSGANCVDYEFAECLSLLRFANWALFRVRWVTQARATAWTSWLNQAKHLAEHQPGYHDHFMITMIIFWGFGNWWTLQDIKIKTVFSKWKSRGPHWSSFGEHAIHANSIFCIGVLSRVNEYLNHTLSGGLPKCHLG